VTLELQINGVARRIEILSSPPACSFRLDEEPGREANVENPERGAYSILMDGRSYDAYVEETPAGLVVTIQGHRFDVEVRDPRRFVRKSGADAGEGVQSIAATMPGKIVRVLVAAGDSVEAGQGLVVVEAMKMQNEMRAPRAGRVVSVAAREGATVAAGETLITLE
jgi:biotin carboxyl carrier protein